MFVLAEGCCRDVDMMAEMGTQVPMAPSISQPDWCHPVPHAAMD